TVDLTVNLNNGTGGPGNQSGLLWGAEVTLSDPTREGYTFSRWNVTAGSGAGITGNAGNAGGKLIMGTTDTTIEAVWIPNQGPGPGPEPEPKCKLAAWLQPFLHVGSFIAGFGAGWITRAATMPWWLIVLLVILGMFLFPLFWWIIL
ncbi:MAG: hypothetical protein FWF60_01730, partial [Oscillospiraceae bacterium]|nr:hypothetical protein [Oscillospiraceae bacterium]